MSKRMKNFISDHTKSWKKLFCVKFVLKYKILTQKKSVKQAKLIQTVMCKLSGWFSLIYILFPIKAQENLDVHVGDL